MKKQITFLLLIFYLTTSAQEATWLSGDSTRNPISVYGTKGVTLSTNTPGGRENSLSWKDSGSNKLLFGGFGYIGSTSQGYLNDLWKWDGSNWTWIAGQNIANPDGNYGTKGVTSSANIPGGRQASAGWIDGSDNLWIFGGQGRDGAGSSGLLNDLWEFDGTDWAWIAGDTLTNQNGNYGTLGISASTNKPGGRYESAYWYDSNGNFWVFGGYSFDVSGNQGYINDLWKWDGTNWTWISGSQSTNSDGNYGTQNVASATNIPGARWEMMYWVDGSDNLWLFGGQGRDGNGDLGYLNDLWKWDGNNWTWVSGDTLRNQVGTYGSMGTADGANVPGGRYNGLSWVDNAGNLLFFGGWGYDSGGGQGYLNDLWKWDGSKWTWVYGSNTNSQEGEYGTQNIASSTNHPGARFNMTGWKDGDNLFLFGGIGRDGNNSTGKLNDLWQFSNAALPVELISFKAEIINKEIYLTWETATELNNYGFEVQRRDEKSGNSWKQIAFIEGAGNTNKPREYSFSDRSVISSGIEYRLKQIDINGNFKYSELIQVSLEKGVDKFQLKQNYPNPFNPETLIKYNLPEQTQVKLSIFNTLGEEVAVLVNEFQDSGEHAVKFDGTKLSSGIYIYKLSTPNITSIKKMMLLK